MVMNSTTAARATHKRQCNANDAASQRRYIRGYKENWRRRRIRDKYWV